MHLDHRIWQLSMLMDEAASKLPTGDTDRQFLERLSTALARAIEPTQVPGPEPIAPPVAEVPHR